MENVSSKTLQKASSSQPPLIDCFLPNLLPPQQVWVALLLPEVQNRTACLYLFIFLFLSLIYASKKETAHKSRGKNDLFSFAIAHIYIWENINIYFNQFKLVKLQNAFQVAQYKSNHSYHANLILFFYF